MRSQKQTQADLDFTDPGMVLDVVVDYSEFIAFDRYVRSQGSEISMFSIVRGQGYKCQLTTAVKWPRANVSD